MKKIFILSILMLLILTLGGCSLNDLGKKAETSEKTKPETKKETSVSKTMAVIKTNYGDIKIELFLEDAPETTANFIKLSEAGFYDGTKFHRVIKGFMIQGGDPLTKDNSKKNYWGTGGPGYTFKDEIHSKNYNFIGTIAMANSGPNTNGSQFFINTANNNYLDSKHTVFGKVAEGMKVVRTIEDVKTEGPDRPIEDVVIETIKITEE